MGAKFRVFAVVVLALTIGVVSLAATATGEKKHGGKVTVIDLTTRTVQEADLDLGATGFSVGDRFVFSDNVFRDSEQVGILGGECTTVRFEPHPVPQGQEPTSVTFQCVASIQLPDGQVTGQGLVTFSEASGPSVTIAITGGTGAYRTAHGEATVTETEGDDVPDRTRLEIIK